MSTYAVRTEEFGVVLKEADNIKEARAWAKKALGVGPRSVARAPSRKPVCATCDSRPCCCRDGGAS